MKIDNFNTPLAVRVLADIEEAKIRGGGEHNQSHWGSVQSIEGMREQTFSFDDGDKTAYVGYGGECGTSQCFAGWTVTELGYPMLYAKPSDEARADLEEKGIFVQWMASNCLVDGEARTVSYTALKALGFPELEHCSPGERPEWDHVVSTILGGYCPKCQELNPWFHFGYRMPKMFLPTNTLEDVYDYVSEHSGVPMEELRQMVADQMAEYQVPAAEPEPIIA